MEIRLPDRRHGSAAKGLGPGNETGHTVGPSHSAGSRQGSTYCSSGILSTARSEWG